MSGDKVVSLSDAREERSPHMTGEAVCLACEYEWQAVAPVGLTEMECPNCACHKGMLKDFCAPEGGLVYNCNSCGGCLFLLKPDLTMMCAGCGMEHNPLNYA